MDITAYNRNVRQSARKVRLLADLVRGLDSINALDQLRVSPRVARVPLEKVLSSALANAEHNFHIKGEDTFIKSITVDQGASLKRWRARAFGRAAPIRKHSCHITVVLGEKPGARTSAPKSASAHSAPQESGLVISQENRENAGAPLPSATEGHTHEIIDTKRMGRHEFDQKNNRETKKQKGFLKKVFNRKAG